MPEKPETVPTEAAVSAVRQQVVERVFGALSAELGCPLAASIEVMANGSVVREAGEARSGGPGAPRTGRVRIRFRQTLDEGRQLFLVDAVFPADDRGRGGSFSGFLVRGDVRPASDGVVATYSAWTVKRNDWDWARWL